MLKEQQLSADVVVIGGGISGLTAAALLNNVGLKTIVLEQSAQSGGYLARYERNGFSFDTSIHWLNHCNSEGVVTKVFKIIGNDFPIATTQHRIKRFLGRNFDYLLTSNPDDLKNDLIKDFPEDKAGIEEFFDAAKKMTPLFKSFHEYYRTSDTMNHFEKIKYHLTRLKFALPFIKFIKYSGKKGKIKGLNRYFKSPVFHEIFSNEPDLLSCLIPIAWAYNKDFQNPPKEGSQMYPIWLAKKINEFGGQILNNAKAEKITHKNGRCYSVIFEQRKQKYEIFCPNVIAACDIISLYEEIMPEEYSPKKMLKKLKSADLYNSAILVNISLDCPAEKFGLNEELIMFNKYELKQSNIDNPETPISHLSVFSQSARNKGLAPEGKGSLTIIMPTSFESNNRWETTTNEKGGIVRGENYKKLKHKYAEIIIDRLEEFLKNDIRKHIIEYNVATPITLWRYTNNFGGSMMGQKPGKRNSMLGVAGYKTPLKGLYISGHWAELGGGVPIAVKAAYNAALLVLKERKHKDFKKYVGLIKGKGR
jgi:phytoene dehydrogenase-like protein